MSIRRPAVAGMFYSSSALELRAEVESCFLGPGGPGHIVTSEQLTVNSGQRRIIGLVSPHAGYMYSGSVAANAYHRLAEDGLPDVVALIGPNHRSHMPPIALADDEAWHTPLGDVPLDKDIIYDIASACPDAVIDPGAHAAEHSLEVQIPFLQYIYGEWSRVHGQGAMADGEGSKAFRIVPILVGAAGWTAELQIVEFARSLGSAISEALKDRDAVIIASTDFTHYESAASAQAKDSKAIEAIVHLDEKALLETVAAMSISMCGVLATAITIAACKASGAASALALAYRTSGDVTQDHSEVVGYAAMEIDR